MKHVFMFCLVLVGRSLLEKVPSRSNKFRPTCTTICTWAPTGERLKPGCRVTPTVAAGAGAVPGIRKGSIESGLRHTALAGTLPAPRTPASSERYLGQPAPKPALGSTAGKKSPQAERNGGGGVRDKLHPGLQTNRETSPFGATHA